MLCNVSLASCIVQKALAMKFHANEKIHFEHVDLTNDKDFECMNVG